MNVSCKLLKLSHLDKSLKCSFPIWVVRFQGILAFVYVWWPILYTPGLAGVTICHWGPH